jgi:hypothetical protein
MVTFSDWQKVEGSILATNFFYLLVMSHLATLRLLFTCPLTMQAPPHLPQPLLPLPLCGTQPQHMAN